MRLPEKAAFPVALISAGLLWLGFPGGGEVWPLLFIGLVPLLLLTPLGSAKKRFFYGLVVGLCHFLFQLYWIVFVLGRYGGLAWYFTYPATVLLSLYMALYFGCFLVLAGGVLQRWGAMAFFWLAPCLWVGLDWLRGVLFSGFPWMDLGYGLWQVPYLLQTADLFGHHFLTFVIVLTNVTLFLLIYKSEKRVALMTLTSTLLVFLASIIYSHYRALQLEDVLAKSESMTFGIVQGNIDQSRKWEPAEQQRTVQTYVHQTRKLFEKSNSPQLVVWPETALPFYPSRNPLFGSLPPLTREGNIALLTGSPWFEIEDGEQRIVNFYNGALLLTPGGTNMEMYFKSHLVPFGEYVPLRKLLFFLAPLVEAVGDFTPGKVEEPLSYDKAHCGVLICFESIFPDITRKWIHAGANVLVNLTNDAWYGRSSAPAHSMAMSVLRAVESRRSLVRAANTGISAFVDPLGRVEESSQIFVKWEKGKKVWLLEGISFHSRLGYLFGPCCSALSVIAAALLILRRRPANL